MRTVGAFEAKTHFSELLRGVEKGETYEIRRRGKVIAKLVSATSGQGELQEALGFFRGMRKHAHASAGEIREWVQEGRR